MPMKTRLFSFVLLLVCSSFTPVHAQAGDSDSKHTLTEITDTPTAPAFTLEDIDGNKVSLADYSGKVVIVNFWATWCPPCRYEMPSMQRAYETLKQDNIEMLAVNVGEGSETIFAFTADYPVEFPLIMDKTSAVTEKYNVAGIPATYVVGPQGKLLYKAIGSREWDHPAIIEKIQQITK
jgi:peroxiredoxin